VSLKPCQYVLKDVLQGLTYHDSVLILFQLHVVVCLFLFDEQARDAQPTLNEVLEQIALASSLAGSLVGLFVGFIVGFLVTSQVRQLAFVAAREKTFVVEDVSGLEQCRTVVVPVSLTIRVIVPVLIPFEEAKVGTLSGRPYSLNRYVGVAFIFRQSRTLKTFDVAWMREVGAVEPTVL